MTLAIDRTQIANPYLVSLARRGHQIVDPRSPDLSPATTSNVLIINPMPGLNPDTKTDARSSTTRNVLNLLGFNKQNLTIRPTILNVDVKDHEQDGYADLTYSDNLRDVQTALLAGQFDGVISLGASIDHRDYGDINGLDTLTNLFQAANQNTGGLFTVCWSSMVAAHHFHGIEKHVNDQKIIGIFDNAVTDTSDPVAHAMAQTNVLPSGRVGYLLDSDFEKLAVQGQIEILAHSTNMTPRADATISFVYDKARSIYMLAPHIEYGSCAIASEYKRDLENAQGGITTPEPIGNWDLSAQKPPPWNDAGIALFDAWLKSARDRKETIDNIRTLNSAIAFGNLTEQQQTLEL